MMHVEKIIRLIMLYYRLGMAQKKMLISGLLKIHGVSVGANMAFLGLKEIQTRSKVCAELI